MEFNVTGEFDFSLMYWQQFVMHRSRILRLNILAVLTFFCGCTSKEQGTSKLASSAFQMDHTVVLASRKTQIQTNYCVVRTNFNSFDYSPHRKFTWTINGKMVTVDSLKEFKIRANDGFDTIVFHNTSRNTHEIILCDLERGGRYEIHYNTCCSDFYLWREDKAGRQSRSVEFKMNEKPIGMKLIGGVGFEAAYLKVGTAIMLTGDYARSALFPNRYHIYVQEFQPWSEDSTMARVLNPVTKLELSAFKDPDYKLIDFQYIFLNDDKLRILVDSKIWPSVERIK